MKPTDKIERLIKKSRYKASAESYDKTLCSFLQAVDDHKIKTSALTEHNIWRFGTESKIVKTTTAVLMITITFAALYMLVIDQSRKESGESGSHGGQTAEGKDIMEVETSNVGVSPIKQATLRQPVPSPPGPDEVRLDRNLNGETLNRQIQQDGLIVIDGASSRGVFGRYSGGAYLWRYDGGTYLGFENEGPLVYLSVDKNPYELAGAIIQSPNDLEILHVALQEFTPDSLAIWCHIQPPDELAELPHADKITFFQQIEPNAVSDLTVLGDLPSLKGIYSRNVYQYSLEAVDVSPLSKLKQLEMLVLSQAHNLPSIHGLPSSLVYLDLNGAINLKDLSPLARLSQLEYLNLHSCYNSVTDISSLASTANLVSLDLFACKFSDLSPLKDMTRLMSLGLCGTLVSDLSPLENLTSLEILNLGACEDLSDLSSLSSLQNLRELDLWACRKISNLWPLAELNNLESLNLRACGGVPDLEALANLDNLEELDIYGCEQISDLSPLSALKNLIKLDINGCPGIMNLWPLKEVIARGTSVHVPDRLKEQLSEIHSQILLDRINNSSVIARTVLLEIYNGIDEESTLPYWKVEVKRTLYGEVSGDTINVVSPEAETELPTTLRRTEIIIFLAETDEEGTYTLIHRRRHSLEKGEEEILQVLESISQ